VRTRKHIDESRQTFEIEEVDTGAYIMGYLNGEVFSIHLPEGCSLDVGKELVKQADGVTIDHGAFGGLTFRRPLTETEKELKQWYQSHATS